MNRILLLTALIASTAIAQTATAPPADGNLPRVQTMKQLVRGTQYAAASMAPESTMTAEHVLHSGGNAFDAIVAGQAVLGVVQPNLNGLGSDATLLVYDSKAK